MVQNVGLAFGLAIAAGLSTSIGASLAFCVRVTNVKVLSAALGASAGVMMYVSFIEIFGVKAKEGFITAGYDKAAAYRYATLTFFGGMALTWALDRVVHLVMHVAEGGINASKDNDMHAGQADGHLTRSSGSEAGCAIQDGRASPRKLTHGSGTEGQPNESEHAPLGLPKHSASVQNHQHGHGHGRELACLPDGAHARTAGVVSGMAGDGDDASMLTYTVGATLAAQHQQQHADGEAKSHSAHASSHASQGGGKAGSMGSSGAGGVIPPSPQVQPQRAYPQQMQQQQLAALLHSNAPQPPLTHGSGGPKIQYSCLSTDEGRPSKVPNRAGGLAGCGWEYDEEAAALAAADCCPGGDDRRLHPHLSLPSMGTNEPVLAALSQSSLYRHGHVAHGSQMTRAQSEAAAGVLMGLDRVNVSAQRAPGGDHQAPSASGAQHRHAHHQLKRLSVLSALAVGLHNLPEGLATFVGTVADPRAGAAIALAIALHNIPEGIVVCMPIYYATGSRWKGFVWSTISGVSEIMGAVVGYLILSGSSHDPPLLYAMVFGIVGGMMVYISIQELLPTALLYDPHNALTTRCAILGMAVMAASLVLFQL